jgi:hypothetical protein
MGHLRGQPLGAALIPLPVSAPVTAGRRLGALRRNVIKDRAVIHAAGILAVRRFIGIVVQIASWLSSGRMPSRRELERLFWSVSPLIANQQFATVQRNRLARIQESEITAFLDANGWTRLPSSLLDTKAALPLKHYMQKTRFATATTRPQEVDIAIGLKRTIVLAMECKVTNDETNSIKRVHIRTNLAAHWRFKPAGYSRFKLATDSHPNPAPRWSG